MNVGSEKPVFENPVWEKARKALEAVSPQKKEKSKEESQNQINSFESPSDGVKTPTIEKEDIQHKQFNNLKNNQGPPRPP